MKTDSKIEEFLGEIDLNEETMEAFAAANMLPSVDKAISDFKKAGYYDLDKIFDPVVKYLEKIKSRLEKQRKRSR